MKILTNQQPQHIDRGVVSIGNFDGIHRGHQQLIQAVCDHARDYGGTSLIITFEPHTRSALNAGIVQPILTTLQEKAVLLKRYAIDYLVAIPFCRSFAAMSAQDFINKVLIDKYGAIEWVMGENHRFGFNREGDHHFLTNLLSDLGKNHFRLFVIKLLDSCTMPASSTQIRTLIGDGHIDAAVELLGHPYLILAKRIAGMKIGTQLGYPTLNFQAPPSDKVIPPPGIYAADIEYDGQRLQGALYFGKCPTFENRSCHFEFYSLDPLHHDPAIGQDVSIWLHRFIRQEKKFDTAELLITQIHDDVMSIKKYFSKE